MKNKHEYELTYCEVEREAEVWGQLKTRVDRTLGLDASLNNEYELHNRRLDSLLEELYSHMGAIGVGHGTTAE